MPAAWEASAQSAEADEKTAATPEPTEPGSWLTEILDIAEDWLAAFRTF